MRAFEMAQVLGGAYSEDRGQRVEDSGQRSEVGGRRPACHSRFIRHSSFVTRHSSLAVALLSALILACGNDNAPRDLIVFAASSLSDAFTEVGTMFEEQHPGVNVQFSFAGSQLLASQIEHGATADVYATANRAWIEYLLERDLVRQPEVFASNDLAVLAGSPLAFQDLANPGLQIVIGTETVPIGQYTRELFARLQQSVDYGPSFVNAIRDNIVSEEDNVRTVVSKVLIGEADAAVVYRTDLFGLQRDDVFVVDVPPAYNIATEYLVGLVGDGDRGSTFIASLTSEAGQALLTGYGFAKR